MFRKDGNHKWDNKLLMFIPDSKNKIGSLYSIKAESLFLCTKHETETSNPYISLTAERKNYNQWIKQVDEQNLIEEDRDENECSFLFENFRGVIAGYPSHILEIDFKSSNRENFCCDLLEIVDSGAPNEPSVCISFYSFCYDDSDCATARIINQISCTSPLFSINLIRKSGQMVMLSDGWSNSRFPSINQFINFVSKRSNSNFQAKQINRLIASRDSYTINSIVYSFDFENRYIILQSNKTKVLRKYKIHSNSSMDPWDDDVEDYKLIRIWAIIKFTEEDLFFWIMKLTSLGKYNSHEILFDHPLTIKGIEDTLSIHFLSSVEYDSSRD